MKLARAFTGICAGLVVSIAAIEGCGGHTNGFTTDGGSGPPGSTLPDGAPNEQFGEDGSFVSLLNDGASQTPDDSGHYADATPNGGEGGACIAGDAGPAPYPQHCAPATTDECGGSTDSFLTSSGISASLLNGQDGNGFDDDCDGLVDEGCPCPNAGGTKDCYLVPPSQIDPVTRQPVGWCTTNSHGSLDCTGTEFPAWSGTCRGAQPPYAHDICAAGDFNCDGLPENSDVEDCTCHPAAVTCPTAPIIEAPYPVPTAIAPVDGSKWVGASQIANTTGWKWTVIGGDCDNILPHPTFAMYTSANSTTAGARIGTRTPVAYETTTAPNEYVSTANAPLISIQASTASGAAGATVYPAFGLSGDYIVQGEFDLAGTHYVCTQQVEVRAPGIRAELCWDTVGGDPGDATGANGTAGANDIDLHMARLQGTSCSKHGWDTVCPVGKTYQDCWYDSSSGCRDYSGDPPTWGYADSPASACIGWGSERSKPGGDYTQGCTNPRLDRDNVTCDPTIDDPTQTGGGDLDGLAAGFCGPENINLDNPANNDQFVVGVNDYDNHGGTGHAHTHVNIYCNGARVVSVGYDPLTATSASTGPVLETPGQEATGDWWEVATVKWDTANAQGCDVATVGSTSPDPGRDGTANTAVCVDSAASGAPKPYKNHEFIEATGAQPTSAAGFCKH
jgi:hypothetical protein